MYPEARKARKPSLQIMCPQQQRRMLNSLRLTSLSVNSYNAVIDQFHAIISPAICVGGPAFQILFSWQI